MIGYLSFYVKVVGRKDTYYVSFNGNFTKPLTQDSVDYILNSFQTAYSQCDEVLTVEFCTKEEYEREIKNQDTRSISWNDTLNCNFR